MLLDISGNTFSSLGNTAPTVIYTPPQILGTGMTIWYDLNDISTLFQVSSGTVNVSGSGQYIHYIKNKAFNRPFYDTRTTDAGTALGSTSNEPFQPLSAYTSSTRDILIFCANTLNTNKNSNIFFHNGSTGGQTYSIIYKSVSGYSTAGKSAFTYSAVYRVNTVNGSFIISSFNSNIFGALITNSNNTSLSIQIQATNTLSINVPINLTRSNGFFCITLTVDQNKNVIMYINNIKVSMGVIQLTYPLLASTNTFSLTGRQGGSTTARSSLNSGFNEFCFNDSEVLTDDKVAKLHQYYSVKYNI